MLTCGTELASNRPAPGCPRLLRASLIRLVAASLILNAGLLSAADPPPSKDDATPGANTPEEPLAKKFSRDSAVQFLDAAALDWTHERKCFTCHTNYAYLMARPLVSHQVPAHRDVRAALEEMVVTSWPEDGPRWDAEVVMTAATLAVNDSLTSGKLHATTRTALERMWTVQKPDGGFDWLKCEWPPMESDDHYGATIAMIGVGAAPEGYAKTPEAQSGIARLREYLQNTPPPTLHHAAMILWAGTYFPDLIPDATRAETITRLRDLQKGDGGWCLATLGDWKRGDDRKQDLENSDGYATGFVIYVLRRARIPADDPQIARGIAWLKANQRESGRWYTRSLFKDNKHFISHAGSAFALMALAECDQLQ